MKNARYHLMMGPAIIIMGLFVYYIIRSQEIIGAFIVAGMIVTVKGMRLAKHGPACRSDERIKKISAWASAYSWSLTMMLVAILYLSIESDLLRIQSNTALGLILFFMSFTMLIAKWYFMRKGDVE